MNIPERNADLFQTNDASSQPAFAEMRLRAEDLSAYAGAGGPAAESANDIGARLKAARESRGLELSACGQSLRLPARVLARLEAGDLGSAEDHVFTRGALHSYARFLNVPSFAVEAALRVVAPVREPVLIPTGSALRGNWLRRYGAAATYIVLTATVAVPLVWLGLRGGLDNQLTRIAPLDNSPTSAAPAQVTQAIKTPVATSAQEQPLLASMTPFPAMNLDSATTAPASPQVASAPAASTSDHVLTLRASAASWVEVADANGKTLDSGMLHAGETRSYHSTAPLSITIGNADGIEASSDGKPLSLAPYRRANTARFQVFAPAANGNG
ncbi:MAG TPA: helix-turn-helix domain-containing protein [Rhodanobacteraceae bacterium]|nr:helix-turn-helix domain-containing protein [Rhodanobacteraceae bacterium]